jgi:uncharacterized RDD family membrane protein YckC
MALAEGAAFCSACGAPVAAAAGPPAAPEWEASHPAPPAAAPEASHALAAYAGFWLRLVAFVIDAIILFFVFTLVISFLAVGMGLTAAVQQIQPGESLDALIAVLGVGFVLATLLILLVGSALYFTLLESSSWQGTLGKKVLGLYVTDLGGIRITFARASGRFFAGKFMVLGVPGLGVIYFCVSCICAGLTEHKQALHDMLAGCLVLRKL